MTAIGTVMGYNLIASKDQQKQTRGCNCMFCLSRKMRLARPDINGDLFPFFSECNKCSEHTLASGLKRAMAEWWNNGH